MDGEAGVEDGFDTPAARQSAHTRKTYLQGVGLLLIVVFLWTASSFITQVHFICTNQFYCDAYTLGIGFVRRWLRETLPVSNANMSMSVSWPDTQEDTGSRTSIQRHSHSIFYPGRFGLWCCAGKTM